LEFVIGDAVFVWELSNLQGAVELARRLASAPGFAWLDSDGSGGTEARFSFLSAAPVEWRRAPAGDFAALDGLRVPEPAVAADGGGAEADAQGASAGAASGAELCPSLVPCWIGYIAYDAPGMCFARYEAVFVFDHCADRRYVAGDDAAACQRLLDLASLAADGGEPARESAQALAADGDASRARNIASSSLDREPERACEGVTAGPVTVADPAEHAGAIAAALALIARGELYQVNLARKLTAPFSGPPLALALAMRDESPVPLGMFFDDSERAVVARSMERFLRWRLPERRLHTRPIKGTRPRVTGTDAAEDRRALASDPKEHAEHAMIVDLMRNDLGRVAAIGSVEVAERFVVEPFARLHHLVSTVACTTRPEVCTSDILRATFPPGSVTGTPKIRAIETIAALEPTPRGIYTGAVGFIDRAGGLSLAVAIRTAVVERGVATYFAGGGIVEASDVAKEIDETVLKARVFTDAVTRLGPKST
jgi:anthranilate/para-aminobenzoate synthase component I